MSFLFQIVDKVLYLIIKLKSELIVGLISGLISSIIVTIVNNSFLAKSRNKYNDNMKKIFIQDLNALIDKNEMKDFIDSIIVSLKTCSLNNNTIKVIDKVMPIIANFASVEEVSNINLIKLILKKLIDLSSKIENSCNGDWNSISNAIIDIYNMYKSEIDSKEIVLIDENKLFNFLDNNKNISKESEIMYSKVFEYIKNYDLLQSCIDDYYKYFDNHTIFSLSDITYKTVMFDDKYYCARCSAEVEKSSKICPNCGARLG